MIEVCWRALTAFAIGAAAYLVVAQEPVLADVRDEPLFAAAAETLLMMTEPAVAPEDDAAFPDLAGIDLLVRLQRRLPARRGPLLARAVTLWAAREHGGFRAPVSGSKRLVDQARILDSFLDAWLVTGELRYRDTARGIVDFLRTRLRLPDGAFAGADSADQPPVRDERTWSGANGVAIGALARAALVLGDEQALVMATAAAAALQAGQWQAGKGLAQAGWRAVNPQPASAWDYACVVQGLLRLHQAGGGLRWLALAVEVQDACDAQFWKADADGYQADRVGTDVPPVDAVAAHNLLCLVALTDDDRWRTHVQRLVAGIRKRARTSMDPALLSVLDTVDGEAVHLQIVGDPTAADTRALLTVAHAGLRPRMHILVLDDSPSFADLRKRFPAIIAMPRDHGAATAYLCFAQRCLPAVSTTAKLAKQLADAVDGR